MEQLKQTISELIKIAEELDLAVSEDKIFEQAVRIYLSERKVNNNKQNINNSEQVNGVNKVIDKFEPATEKQLACLEKMGLQFKDNLSKKEASLLIKENLVGKNDQENYL